MNLNAWFCLFVWFFSFFSKQEETGLSIFLVTLISGGKPLENGSFSIPVSVNNMLRHSDCVEHCYEKCIQWRAFFFLILVY